MLQASAVFVLMALPGFHALLIVALSVISASEHAGKINIHILWFNCCCFCFC